MLSLSEAASDNGTKGTRQRMSTYCISDIHGCYDEFMELLAQIQFDRDSDTLYVLGDAIDRGDRPIDCLDFIRKTPHIHYILGNHDVMMLDYLDGIGGNWLRNGCQNTLAQLNGLNSRKRESLLNFVRSRPYYRFITVNGKKFMLIHAGLNREYPLTKQSKSDLLWLREGFYRRPAIASHICVFGHTPTSYIRNERDCSVWYDEMNNDKICIDCGCVYGGALAALRLDDGQTFYVKSNRGRNAGLYHINPGPVPESFWQAKRPARVYQRRPEAENAAVSHNEPPRLHPWHQPDVEDSQDGHHGQDGTEQKKTIRPAGRMV